MTFGAALDGCLWGGGFGVAALGLRYLVVRVLYPRVVEAPPLVAALMAATAGAFFSGWLVWAWTFASPAYHPPLSWMKNAFECALIPLVPLALPFAVMLLMITAACALPPVLLVWLPLWAMRRRLAWFWRYPVAVALGSAVVLAYWALVKHRLGVWPPDRGPDRGALSAASYVGSVVGGACMFALGCVRMHANHGGVEMSWGRAARRHLARLLFIGGVAWVGLGAYLYSPRRHYEVAFDIVPETRFQGFPGGRVLVFAGDPALTNHEIWGDIGVDVGLPDGKRIRGVSSRLNVFVAEERVVATRTTYTPRPQLDDTVGYWKSAGTLDRPLRSGDRELPQSADYTIYVDQHSYALGVSRVAEGLYSLDFRFPPPHFVPPPLVDTQVPALEAFYALDRLYFGRHRGAPETVR